jgi:hypothetical protein
MKKLFVLLGLVAGFAQAASAADFTALGALNQAQFQALSEDFGAALSYKSLQPADPLGITGFDVSLEATSTDISKSGAALNTATGGSLDITRIIIPKLHVSKGLPFGIDVAASYSSVPSTDIKLIGGELRYAIIKGGVALPAVAIRAAISSMTGVPELDFNTKSLDLSISKGFLMFTPYAGFGQVWVTSTPHLTTNPNNLTEQSFTLPKTFIGLNLNFGLINFALEGDKTGDASSTSFKFGFRW